MAELYFIIISSYNSSAFPWSAMMAHRIFTDSSCFSRSDLKVFFRSLDALSFFKWSRSLCLLSCFEISIFVSVTFAHLSSKFLICVAYFRTVLPPLVESFLVSILPFF